MFAKRSEQLTLVGSIMLAVGAFAPMINLAGLGTVSYADASGNEVYLLVIAGLAAAGLIVAGKKQFSIFAVLLAWIVLLWPMLKNIGSGGDDGGLLGKVTKTITDPLKDLTGRLFSNVFDFEWGGFVFLLGLILLTVGGVMVFLESRKV
ncbi:MAG: hypothetical protein AB3N28_07415 [Kordiimonas sp.]